jgi:hypothetical protein
MNFEFQIYYPFFKSFFSKREMRFLTYYIHTQTSHAKSNKILLFIQLFFTSNTKRGEHGFLYSYSSLLSDG